MGFIQKLRNIELKHEQNQLKRLAKRESFLEKRAAISNKKSALFKKVQAEKAAIRNLKELKRRSRHAAFQRASAKLKRFEGAAKGVRRRVRRVRRTKDIFDL